MIHQRPAAVDCFLLFPYPFMWMFTTYTPRKRHVFPFPGASSHDSTCSGLQQHQQQFQRAPALIWSLGACLQSHALGLSDKENPSGMRYPSHQRQYFYSTLIIFPILILAVWSRKESCIIFLLSRNITQCSAYAVYLYWWLLETGNLVKYSTACITMGLAWVTAI